MSLNYQDTMQTKVHQHKSHTRCPAQGDSCRNIIKKQKTQPISLPGFWHWNIQKIVEGWHVMLINMYDCVLK